MSGGFRNREDSGTDLTASEVLWVQSGDAGILLLDETTAPSSTSGVGKVYVKASDSNLYYKDDSGTEFQLNSVSGDAYSIENQSSATLNEANTTGHVVILCDATANNITVNLPTAVGSIIIFDIKKTDSSANTVTVDGNTTETIDGGTTAVLAVQNESITIISDNANWRII